MTTDISAGSGARRGRPPGTSARELELIALRLFTEQGFDETTVDQIAAAARVSRRTFFRYYVSKSDVLWNEFDNEVETIRRLLAEMPDELPVMEAVRRAVVAANHYRAEDVPELRMRMNLLNSVPELIARAAIHYDAWERAVSDFVARRSGQPADSLYPLAVGRAVLASCRAGYDRWAARADADLPAYLDAALRALAAGFSDDVIVAEPEPGSDGHLAGTRARRSGHDRRSPPAVDTRGSAGPAYCAASLVMISSS